MIQTTINIPSYQKQANLRRNRSNQITSIGLLLLLLVPSLLNPVTIGIGQIPAPPAKSPIIHGALTTVNGRVEETIFVPWWGNSMSADTFPKGTILQVNITVLPCSNASVLIYDRYHSEDNFTYWTPIHKSFTLAPGESTGAVNYTLVGVMLSNILSLFMKLMLFRKAQKEQMPRYSGGTK